MPRGLETTAANEAAVRNLNETLARYLRFGIDTGDWLKRTLAEDPEMALAPLREGLFLHVVSACRRSPPRLARVSKPGAAPSRNAAPRTARGATSTPWMRGTGASSSRRPGHLEAILASHPRDILALKIAHYLYFYLGDNENHRDSIGRVLHAWDDTVDGYGYVLGMQAFSLEESGAWDEAGACGPGRGGAQPGRPVGGARGSRTSWRCRTAAARASRGSARASRSSAIATTSATTCGGTSRCSIWNSGRWSRCCGSTTSGCGPICRTNTSTSATRLRCCGGWKSAASTWATAGTSWRSGARPAPPTTRWSSPTCTTCSRSRPGGRDDAVERMLDSMRAFAEGAATEQAVMRSAGVPVGEAIAHWYRGEYAEVVDALAPVRYRLPLIGGSHAQRDLFHQILIAAALACGRYETARALLSERIARRPRNPWTWKRYARALAALDDEGAVQARETAARLLAA